MSGGSASSITSSSAFTTLVAAARHNDRNQRILGLGMLPEPALWTAKALYFRARADGKQEFLALVYAREHREACRAFAERLAPELVIARDYARLFKFARLLHRVARASVGRLVWRDLGLDAYLLFPMARNAAAGMLTQAEEERLVDGLSVLSQMAAKRGDGGRMRAAVADCVAEVIAARARSAASSVPAGAMAGGSKNKKGAVEVEGRLFGLLPGDVRERYWRDRVLVGAL